MNLEDILHFTVHGTNGDEYWENDHFYRVTAISSFPEGTSFSAVAAAYYTAWIEDWVLSIAAMIANECVVRGCKAENLFSLVELGAYVGTPIPGDVTSSEPLFTEASLVFNQPSGRRGMHGGRKAMAGLAEIATASLGIINPSYASATDAWADFLSRAFVLTDADPAFSFTIEPCIVQRIDDPIEVTVTKHRYRLPADNDEAVTYPATSWAVAPYASTQNTRKRGRGI